MRYLRKFLKIPKSRYSARQIIGWLWRAWRGNRLQASLNAILGLIDVAISLLSVWAVKHAIDVASHAVEGSLYWAVAIMALLILGGFAVNIASIWVKNILGIKAQNRMQQRLLARILRSEWHGKEKWHSGDVLNRLEFDVSNVVGFLTETLPSTLSVIGDIRYPTAHLISSKQRLFGVQNRQTLTQRDQILDQPQVSELIRSMVNQAAEGLAEKLCQLRRTQPQRFDAFWQEQAQLWQLQQHQQSVLKDNDPKAMKQVIAGLLQEQIQQKISQLGIFSYFDLQYAPRDTIAVCDTLDVTMQATFAKPLDAELELNVVTKSNDQTGPGASFGVTRNNVFGGGESWNVKLKGSYEWQTGGGEKNSLMNSWEMGVSTSLTFPRVLFPHLGKREFDFPATTTFRLYIDQLNRAKYYKLLSFGGNATYDFQPSRTSRHSITPFKLTFNDLHHQSDEFRQIATANPALYVSLQNQFIPAMEYTYTYDNSSLRWVKNPIWWQSTVTSAGNLTSVIYRALGKPFDEHGKSLLGAPFAQFVKLNSEIRHLWNMDKNNKIIKRKIKAIGRKKKINKRK